MTHEGLTGESVGRRVAGWRRARGFKSARELAGAVPGGVLSASVIQNIEAGRKTDLAVSDVLNLAFALRIPPTFLLFPMADPTRRVDLVGLNPELAEEQVFGLEAWFALEGRPYLATAVEDLDRHRVLAQRELFSLSREIRALERSRMAAAWQRDHSDLSDADLDLVQTFDTTAARLRSAQERATELRAQLEIDGWQTGSERGEVEDDVAVQQRAIDWIGRSRVTVIGQGNEDGGESVDSRVVHDTGGPAVGDD